MSNLSGSVDVVRERERQARQQQFHEYRDPSPQPIFSQPVKVELEDPTSRLIKNTLGDFTKVQHVLFSDPKHLIGISQLREATPQATQFNAISSTRSSDSASDFGDTSSWSAPRNHNGSSHPSSNHHSSNRSVLANKRPVPYNGMHKAPTSVFDANAASKRAHHPSSKQASGDKKVHHHHHHHHPGPSKHNRMDHPPKIAPLSNSYNGPSDPERFQDMGDRDPTAPRDRDRRTKGAPVPTNGVPCAPTVVPVGGSASCIYNSCAVKHSPPQPPPPLSSLQNGTLPNGLIAKRLSDPVSSKRTQPKQSIPKLSIPPQEERSDLSHFEVESILKEMKQAVPPPLTAIQTPRTEERGFSFSSQIKKEESSYGKSSLHESNSCDREPVPSASPGRVHLSPAKKSPDATSFNLQEDLEMSDSDDEENIMVPLKSPELSELAPCPKSPMNEEAVPAKPPLPAGSSMSLGAAEKVESVREPAAISSSSESSESESEESGSESNDSESSSESSELDFSKKPAAEKWGLSNFIIESQRNHSPGLVLDTNTNSSCNAVKDEPPASVIPDKDDFSIADEDSVNCLLSSKYSDRGIHFRSPPDDFFMDNHPIIKSGIVSPIPSPVASPVPPPAAAPVARGPRTPPFPPDDDDESEVERRKDPKRDGAGMDGEDSMTSRSKSLKSSSKSEKNVAGKSRPGEDRQSRSKKKPVPKARKETPSPKGKGDKRKESSASREPLVDPSKDVVSRPVPSAVNSRATTHRSPLKPPHKHSLPAKRDSSQVGSNGKALPESKIELAAKSKNASRHPEQVEEASNSSRGNSRPSSATRSSEVAPAKVESEKPELHGKHSQRSKESHKMSSGQKAKPGSVKNSSKSRPKSDSRPAPAETKKPSEKRKKSSKFSIRNFLQEPDHSGSNFNEPSPRLASGRSSPGLLDSPEVSPRREDDGDDDSDDSVVRASRPVARNSSSLERSRRKSSSSSSSRSRSRSGSRASKQRDNRRSIGGTKRPTSRSSDKKKKHRIAARSTLDADLNADNSKSLPPQSSPAPPPPLSQMLSPIHSVKSESAIPSLMVSIPLSKLLRIPGKAWNAEIPPKDAHENVAQPQIEQRSSTSRAVSPAKKDFKAKHRTDPAKSVVSSSSDKGTKSAKLESASVKVSSPAGNEKSSFESSDHSAKLSKSADGQPIVKKRKSEKSEADHSKKKARMSSSQMSPKSSDALQMKMREKTPVVKIERLDKTEICSQSEKRTPPKRLERCDSASSLSSLCSQQSQKSSKASKEKTKSLKDGEKKAKPAKPMTLLTAKEIKKEKEDKPKICVKKEPGVVVKNEKVKSRMKEKLFSKAEMASGSVKLPGIMPSDGLNPSSQISYWDGVCKIDDIKPQSTNHPRLPLVDYSVHQDTSSDWERFAPDIQQELKSLPSHINSRVNEPGPMAYYFAEGKKLKNLAAKETDPIQQALKYFEATVMFILTSHHRELSNKDPDSIYQIYKDTLRFTHVIRSGIQKHQAHSISGNIDFKILILCLKCQSLLHLKLYSLKSKEVKEQHKSVSDFMHSSSSRMGSHSSPQPAGSSSHSRNLSQPSPCQPRVGPGSVPSPHSPTPSPAGSVASVGSQSSGYSSSEVNGNNPSRPHSSLQLPHMLPHGTVTVPQTMFDVMARHHTHLGNLHMCHELWEQADMYMTRSNSKEFFREVAEKSEKKLSLHSNIKDLVSYLQAGLELMRNC